MFGHLSAEDFTNLLEGATLSDGRLAHLQSCLRCTEKFESVQAIRGQIEAVQMDPEEFIPEPDWSEFRSDVRNALLSRSVRREAARRSWFGIPLKPAMASGIAALLILGLTITTSVLWDQHRNDPSPAPVAATIENFPAEDTNLDTLAGTSQMDALDDLLQLNADEVASLDMILDDLTEKGVSEQ